VQARFPTQYPEFLLDREDAPLLFDDSFLAEWAGYVYFSGEQQVKISGGAFHGLKIGAVLFVYPPLTTSFESARPIGTLRVSRLNDTDSTAEIVRGESVPAGSVVRPPAIEAGTQLSVWIDTGALNETNRQPIEVALHQNQDLRVVESQSNAQLQVTSLDDGFAIVSGDLTILDSGLRSIRDILAKLDGWVRWFAVLELKNPLSELPIAFTVSREEAADDSLVAIRPGDIIRYEVINPSNRAVFVHGLIISSDGTVNQLRELSTSIGPYGSISGRMGTFLPDGRESVTDHLKIIAASRKVEIDDLLTGSPEPYKFQRGDWATRQVRYVLKRQNTRVNSFAVHVSDPSRRILDDFDTSGRTICDESGSLGCMIGEPIDSDETIIVLDRTFQRSDVRDISPAEAFQEAYELQRQLNVDRVEPLFEAAFGDDYANVAGRSKVHDNHDPSAEGDKRWSVDYIRAPEAWKLVRRG
jgi:hypothetical protein